jgi:two-component system sensor histidine kinase MprB
MSRWKQRRAKAMRVPERAATSLSLRWRVMLLAMSMVAMVVVLMAVAVYAVVSAALYTDIDNQLQSRAQLLIASGSLAADPAKAIEGTAYSDVNAMLVNPGRSIYTANQQGQSLPVGQPEKAVIRGELFMSRRTVGDQRVLAIHLPNGSSLLISKSLQPTNAVMTKLKWVLLAVGGIGVVIAAVAGGMVARTGLRPVGQLTEAAERVARTDDLRPIPVLGSDELARLTEAFNAMLSALAELMCLQEGMTKCDDVEAMLSTLDELISAESQKIDALKAYKQGLMQQLFPTLENTP